MLGGPWARALALLLATLTSGFAWPGRVPQLVNELTSAHSPRDKRDALRMLGEVTQRGELGAADLGAVERACEHADPDVRAEAWALLLHARGPSLPLEAALRDSAAPVRALAIEALGARSSATPVNPSLEADAKLRAVAVRALAASAHEHALAWLLEALRDDAPDVRVAAARALVARGPGGARDALLSALDDGLPELRVAVLDGLDAETDLLARSACLRALDDADEAVVSAALRCAARSPAAMRDQAVRARAEGLASSLSPALAEAAKRLGARARAARPASVDPPWLDALAQTADPALPAHEAERVLSKLERALPPGQVLAGDPLLLWLPSAPHPLRARIAKLLAVTAARLDAARVRALLDERSPRLRAAYVRLLAQTDGGPAAPLVDLLDDAAAAAEVREAAVHALSHKLDSPGLQTLLRKLDGAPADARRRSLRVIAEALGRFERTRVALDETLLRAATRALGRVLEGGDEPAAALALRGLGALAGETARALVRGQLDDARPLRRIAALRASLPDHGQEARARRRASVDDPHAGVSSTAWVALALAGDALPVTLATQSLHGAAWPRGPAASFALAHAHTHARTHAINGGVDLRAALTIEGCGVPAGADPITRINLLAMLSQDGAAACASELAIARSALASQFRTPRRAGEPALLLQDSRAIVSLPDASDGVRWPGLESASEVSAFVALDAPR